MDLKLYLYTNRVVDQKKIFTGKNPNFANPDMTFGKLMIVGMIYGETGKWKVSLKVATP